MMLFGRCSLLRTTGMDSRCRKLTENIWVDLNKTNHCAFEKFSGTEKNGKSMLEVLSKVDNFVFKLQLTDEKISDNLKVAIVVKLNTTHS